jgi:hypothetical protein
MKLGLTIFYRLLLAIEIAWGGGFFIAFWDHTPPFSSNFTFEALGFLVVGVVGVAFLHLVFTFPIGEKLAEDKHSN